MNVQQPNRRAALLTLVTAPAVLCIPSVFKTLSTPTMSAFEAINWLCQVVFKTPAELVKN